MRVLVLWVLSVSLGSLYVFMLFLFVLDISTPCITIM